MVTVSTPDRPLTQHERASPRNPSDNQGYLRHCAAFRGTQGEPVLRRGLTGQRIVAQVQDKSDPPVDLASVGDPQGEDDQFGVLDGVDHAVVAHPDSPQRVVSDQSPTPCWSWFGAESGDCPCDPSGRLPVELVQLLAGCGVVSDCVAGRAIHKPRSRSTSSAEMT